MKGNVYRRDNRWVVKYPGKPQVYKRFKNKEDAELFLGKLRVTDHEGSFDAREYRKDKPLGLENLGTKWLEYRKGQVRCLRNLQNHLHYAFAYFGNRNIKTISYADLEDFLHDLPQSLSGKSKKNILATLHAFFVWTRKRQYIERVPDFPTVSYTLGWRNTVDKETQQAIIEEVKRISYDINPKIWIGIKWLATYVSIRPIELINIQEGDFDLSMGVVNVKHNKENKPKIVPLLPEDIELIRSYPKAFPNLHFFRHNKRKGVHQSKKHRFGKDYLYKWWKTACGNLGIEGVDLYGGTRHSSVRALRERFSPDQIKRATMHHTNAAFERYFQVELEDSRSVYSATLPPPKEGQGRKGKLLKLKE